MSTKLDRTIQLIINVANTEFVLKFLVKVSGFISTSRSHTALKDTLVEGFTTQTPTPTPPKF